MCSTPSALQIAAMSTGLVSTPASVFSLPGLVWPPVIAVMLLSWISTVTLVRWCTALSRPVRPRVQEGGVADHGDRAGVAAAGAREALFHRDAGAHLHGRVHVAHRRQRGEVVAADVAVHVEVELLHRGGHAAVRAPGAQHGRPRDDGDVFRGLLLRPARQVEAGVVEAPADPHRRELAPLREPALALAGDAGREQLLLEVRLELLDHEQAVDGRRRSAGSPRPAADGSCRA